jgi:hypothetical protein
MSHTMMRDGVWSENECLNDEDRAEMDKPFTEKEIKDVVDQMDKSSLNSSIFYLAPHCKSFSKVDDHQNNVNIVIACE